jgi:hypothetical protein
MVIRLVMIYKLNAFVCKMFISKAHINTEMARGGIGGTRIPLIFHRLKSRNETKNYQNLVTSISSLFLRIRTKLYLKAFQS